MTNEELLTPNKVIRSKRRSIAIIISNSGDLVIRAPIFSSDKDIHRFINEKADWIIKKRLSILQDDRYLPLRVEQGETLTILGREYVIKTTSASRVKVDKGVLVIPTNKSKEKLINYLKRELKIYLNKRVAEIAEQINFTYSGIRINSAHTCWGSCSGKNSLNFTYKLAICPFYVIDYIIVHELCHTVHKNHSKRFWSLVNKIYPSYKSAEKWLKDNNRIINVI